MLWLASLQTVAPVCLRDNFKTEELRCSLTCHLFSLRNENVRGILIDLTAETITVCLAHLSYGYNETSARCYQKKQHYKMMKNFPVPVSWVRRGKTQQYTQNKELLIKKWDIQPKEGKSSLQRPETASWKGRSFFTALPSSSSAQCSSFVCSIPGAPFLDYLGQNLKSELVPSLSTGANSFKRLHKAHRKVAFRHDFLLAVSKGQL